MTINPILKIIRAKKFGILIKDARIKSGKSVEECATAMGITPAELERMESGERPPTLPELEILAYTLEIPLDHFFGNQVLEPNGNERIADPEEIKQLRQSAIGALIRKARIEAALSVDELAEKAGITTQILESYEKGVVAIPLPELEVISRVLNHSVASYENEEGQVGGWFAEQKSMREFMTLPNELQDFVGKPVNRPYIELAIKLSELKVERLRALAEGLLEITL